VRLALGATIRAHPGERRSGDAAVLRTTANGALFGVVDALGHGEIAADVADIAVEHAMEVALVEGIGGVVRRLDEALRGTRGAAALLCLVVDDTLEACGIGNVELRTVGVKLPTVVTPGILGHGARGHGLSRLRVFGGRLVAGSRLVLFSDGVSGRLRASEGAEVPAQAASAMLLERHARPHDDAAVLVADVMP